MKASTDNLSEDFKLTVFACAVDIALADGVLEEEEKDIINQMAASLSIPEDIAISHHRGHDYQKQGVIYKY